jgi:hypothetical protein
MALLFFEGYKRQAVPTEPIPGVYPELGIWIPIQDAIDKYLLGICIKPQGTLTGKDNDYGCGLIFGPLVVQAIGVRPAVDISSIITAFVGMAMLGMVMSTMTKVLD